jgi:nitrate reductase NapE component
MDQQQGKPSEIRVGAGLEESRLNQDFLDFLRKWSTPILLVAAVGALGFVGWQKYHQAKKDKLDAAFGELEGVSVSLTPSPDSLAAVATQYSGVGAVSALAHNQAGDSLMFSLQTGLKAGAQINPDGTPKEASDVLSDADRTSILSQAASHYQQALDASEKNKSQRPITFGALFGLAAVAESRSEMDQAKKLYERIIALADADPAITLEDGKPGEKPFAMHAAVAKHRIETLGNLSAPVLIVSESQLPKLPEKPGAALPPIVDLPAGGTPAPTNAAPAAPDAPAAPATDKPAETPAIPPAAAPK